MRYHLFNNHLQIYEKIDISKIFFIPFLTFSALVYAVCGVANFNISERDSHGSS